MCCGVVLIVVIIVHTRTIFMVLSSMADLYARVHLGHHNESQSDQAAYLTIEAAGRLP